MTGRSRLPIRHVDRPQHRPDLMADGCSPADGRCSLGPPSPGNRGRRRHRVRWMALVLFTLGWVASGAGPAEARDSPARKLGRGFANLGLGVLTLPAEVVDTGRRHGPFVGATWGLVKGVTLTAVTEVVGIWEILTAPYPFPPEFKPIVSPEFPWQRFEAERRREPLEQRPPPRVR